MFINTTLIKENVTLLQSVFCEDDNHATVSPNTKNGTDHPNETALYDEKYCSPMKFILISMVTTYLSTINFLLLILNISMVMFQYR